MRACAAAVVGLLVGLSGCSSPDRPDPSPVAPTSRPATTAAAAAIGPPPEISWWSSGELHVDGATIRTRMHELVSRGGTTIVGRADGGGSRWMVVRGQRLVELFSTRALGAHPVLSANGRFAAWATYVDTHRYNLYEADTTFTVTAYDVRRGGVIGTTELGSHTFCCDGGGVISVSGVDNDGAVILARYSDRAWSWRPGREPVQLSGPVKLRGVSGIDPWPGGVSWTSGSSSSDPAVYARVSPSGRTVPLGRVPVSQDGIWSPDGASYAYQPFSKLGRRRAMVWSLGSRVRLHARHVGGIVGWESRRSVVLVTRGSHGRPGMRPAVLIRCHVATGDCEQAGPPIRGAHLPENLHF